jgi:hypothetical protein
MLSVSGFPQFRPQTDSIENSCAIEKLSKCKFLPANFYPIQTPGYTVHWSEKELKVVERVTEGAKIVLELNITDICKVVVFDTVPMHERRGKRRKEASGGLIESLTGWFWKWSKNQAETETSKIVQVIPLMYDKTLFDLVVVLKEVEREVFGFVRMRLLMTGSFKNVQKLDGFIPAVTGENLKFVNWKSLMIAVTKYGGIKVLDMNESEAKWRDSNVKGSLGCDDVIICEDKYQETAVLLLKNGIKIEIFELGKVLIKHVGTLELLENDRNIFGYIEGDELFVIQEKTLYKKLLKSAQFTEVTRHIINEPENGLISYLVPWRQDFQVSALIVYISKASNHNYKISVLSIDGIESSIIHESEEFNFDFDIDSVSLFVSSSLEIFLSDSKGNVQIYSGLLLNSDWEWQQPNETFSFEFSQWFNILGNFSFRSYEYYKERRIRFNDTLFIDDILAEYQISFPPVDWKGLGKACMKLKVEIILYYLLACDTGQEKINSFYYNFGLTDKQVALIETCFYADHGQVSKAIKIFCTRKMDEIQRNQLVPKIVKYLKFEGDNEELILFSLFCAGRLISIDLLISEEITMNLMIESILDGRGISVALEWIKGLFAWLRPDDRSALIPVASLHQKLLKRILNVLLSIKNNSKFKSLGNDFIESQFDPDTLRSILEHLSGCGGGDRAAWMMTMICASRGRLHRFLLDFDFEGIVEDEEVLKGIEQIKAILRPLVVTDLGNGNNLTFNANNNNNNNEHEYEYDSSPLIIPGTPQMNYSNSLKSISYNSPSKMVNVYARTPSSPKQLYSSPNSPTFTPKHYPPKKPTMLSSSLRRTPVDKEEEEGEEEEADPFKNDLIKLSGKRAREEILELKGRLSVESKDFEVQMPVMLTKPENDLKFESEIKVVEVKRRKSKRRRKE